MHSDQRRSRIGTPNAPVSKAMPALFQSFPRLTMDGRIHRDSYLHVRAGRLEDWKIHSRLSPVIGRSPNRRFLICCLSNLLLYSCHVVSGRIGGVTDLMMERICALVLYNDLLVPVQFVSSLKTPRLNAANEPCEAYPLGRTQYLLIRILNLPRHLQQTNNKNRMSHIRQAIPM